MIEILENKAGKIYIGVTENLEQRISSHNRQQGSDWTQGKGPWKIIYTEEYSQKTDALAREKYLKKQKQGNESKKFLTSHIPR